MLTEAMSVLQDLQSYSGAGEAIRQVSTSTMHFGFFTHQPGLHVTLHDELSLCCV